VTSIWQSLAAYTHDQIKNLGLSGLPDEQLYLRRVIVDRDVNTPCIVVAPFGAEEQLDGSVEDLAIVFPVMVAFVWASNQDYSLPADAADLAWREAIMDEFSDYEGPLNPPGYPGLSGVDISQQELVPQDVVNLSVWSEQNITAGGILFRYHTNRKRKR
jgi:hypothetical protein